MDLLNAKKMLTGSEYTCVLCRGENVRFSTQRGITPLLDWLDGKERFEGFSAADKAVGKAPACIYCLMGVKSVYANIMSTAAIEIFERFGVKHECVLEVPMIRNRTNTGFCPVELAVKDCSDLLDVVKSARNCLAEMNQK